MAYEKTEWKSGDTITAEKLNHMEDGIENINNLKIKYVPLTYDEEFTTYTLHICYNDLMSLLRENVVVTTVWVDYRKPNLTNQIRTDITWYKLTSVIENQDMEQDANWKYEADFYSIGSGSYFSFITLTETDYFTYSLN